MKNLNLLICMLLLSCGEDSALNKDDISSIRERHEGMLLQEALEKVEVKDSLFPGEKNIFELSSPLWYLDQTQLRIFGPVQYKTLDLKSTVWGNVQRYFFRDLGRHYFDLKQEVKVPLSVANLFSSDVNLLQEEAPLERSSYEISGSFKTVFFPVKNYKYTLNKSHLMLSFDEVYPVRNIPLFKKKLVKGENFFFNSDDMEVGRIDDFYLERQSNKLFHQHSKYKTIEVHALGFNFRDYSYNQFKELIKENYNILFFFKNDMRVFLFKKSLDLFSMLKKIDPGIEFDENNQILRTSTLKRNLFLQDIPRPNFMDNNLGAEGALLFSQSVDGQLISLFFEGRYKDILDNQYQYFPTEKRSKEDHFTFNIDRGEIFKIDSKFNHIKHKFKEYIKNVEVANKKPTRECERPERIKFCIDIYKKYKKKAIFREYLSKEVVAEGPVKEEDIYSVKGDRSFGTINLFNESFYYKIKDEKLSGGKVKVQLKKPVCKKIKTGFIKLVEEDDSVNLATAQQSVIRTYCDGPLYENRIKKIKLK